MTAISAPRATANPFTSTPSAHIRIPGSARTYEVRDVLRGMGLRWDPVSHAWHGTLSPEKGALLGRQFGLRPLVVPTIEAFAAPDGAPKPPVSPARPPRPHDGSKTRAEARVAFPDADPNDEDAPVSRRFTLLDITSGLPDDSRETAEKEVERRLRDLRGRVKAARAIVSSTPGLAEVIASNWRRAARFYTRNGITEKMFRHGVPAQAAMEGSTTGAS